jgi:hypothetical protein
MSAKCCVKPGLSASRRVKFRRTLDRNRRIGFEPQASFRDMP